MIMIILFAGTKSLYNFAKVITQAFNFYFDHCFGFYDNFQRYHDSKKAYELFVDIGEEPLTSITKGVKRTKIQQAFKNPGDKMPFLFDYGDGWYFAVELKEIKNAEKWDLKPVILESVGEVPLQYPPCEDEFEENEA
ncbi:plasmid pRiA4b ORF-3 family protein [Patescibacteria group bacterium]|nr:plasmid pRiA4b ORF-3 family protein [Patescibacteria group bacterium]